MIDSPPFPDLPSIGRLEILDVFAYHDGPRLFTARNRAGHLFLVEWASADDGKDVWLLAPLSLSRYRSLASRQIDFRSVFVGAETGFVYEAEVSRRGAPVKVASIAADTIPEVLLPEKDERVDEEESAAIPMSQLVFGGGAFDIGVPAVDLRLSPLGLESGIVETKELAKVLTAFQGLCDAVYKSTVKPIKGKVQASRLRLGIAGAYTGSLGLVITSIGMENPDVAKSTAETLRKVTVLVDSVIRHLGEVQMPQNVIRPLATFLDWFGHTEVRGTIRMLAGGATEVETNITPVEGASAAKALRRSLPQIIIEHPPEIESPSSIEPPSVPAALEAKMATQPTIERHPYEIEGYFVSLDTNRMTYQFRDARSDRVFRGNVRERAVQEALHITFGRLYAVTIESKLNSGHGAVSEDIVEIR
jgi:hypothetical protein